MDIDKFHPLVLNIGKASSYADWNWQNVCSPFARIYYVVGGMAKVTMKGLTCRLRPGYMYLIPPFTPHSTQCDGRFIHYYVHIYEDITGDGTLFDEIDFPIEIKAQKGDMELFERLARLNPLMTLQHFNPDVYDNNSTLVRSISHNKQRSEWLKVESRGIVYQLFSRFMEKADAKPFTKDQRIMRTIRTINDNVSRHISVEQLAKEAGLSTEHYIRLFSKIMGATPLLYINQKRIERAQLLLLTTDDAVKDVALSVGYTDNSYFVRAFKRLTGTTPTGYRKQAKDN